MRVLLVEDNAGFAGEIEIAVRAIHDCELAWVISRDDALAQIAREPFDLVILDRRIPTANGVLDDHQEHGWLVFQFIRSERPGTPVWFLTGTEDADFAAEINNEYGRVEDILGRNEPEQMYRVFWKKSIVDCVRRIREFATHCADLDRIAIRPDAGVTELKPEEERVLRMFGRMFHGTVIDLTSFNGGFSRSRVLKVVVRDAENLSLIAAAAKVSPLPDISDEADRYRNYISRLTPGAFPQLTVKIECGAGNFGGLFYGMVGDANVESLFQRIASNGDGLAAVPALLHGIEEPWYGAKRLENVQVAQIRRRLIGDAALHEAREQLDGIDIGPVEACSVRAAHCSQHGDLHCANVVFGQDDRAMLIDFGDAGPSFAALDPVTLELSTIFHTQHAALPPGWPTEAAMGDWVTVEHFARDCAFASFIGACREWAMDVAASPEEVVAAAYAYAMRQLKYGDTNKVLARALIRACITHLVN